MSLQGFQCSESGISTVVSAVLLLGLIVLVLTVFNVSYVPEWKTDAELVHMDEVYDDMARLKACGDLIALSTSIDPDSVTSLSVPIKLGGGYIPVVGPGKSSGTLLINERVSGIQIEADNASNSSSYSFDMPERGSISYTSNNNYYIDQVLTYENGALIVSQKDRSIMRLTPPMYIRNLGGDNYSVNVNSIVLVGETRSISSSGTQDVRLDPYGSIWLFRNNESLTDIRIAVNSSYPSSWAESFNTSALAAGLIYSTDFMVTEGENYASISLFPTGSLELYLRESTIGVSTGIF